VSVVLSRNSFNGIKEPSRHPKRKKKIARLLTLKARISMGDIAISPTKNPKSCNILPRFENPPLISLNTGAG
jgi:hypothetical protein